ncbi:MAG: DNA recombination protein RmuC, partial [Ignavibacteria bacterium]|nr:DNA recombination protein RmuC [Ignavibacteria bacterium]
MEIIYLIIGILIGTLFTFFISKYKFKSGVSKSEERSSLLQKEIEKTENELSTERDKVLKLNSELSASKTELSNLQERLDEERKEIEKLQVKFTKEFENLANKILEEKSVKFTEQNRENLDQILKPLSEKIKDFEKKVEDKYLKESSDRASLVQQIKTLHELNQQMSKDASNLTKALKGDSKARGSWGEFILESVLEKSGLMKDREYKIQESFKSTDGKLQKPDVIVYLPDDKNIIIDSKVSLIAYEQFS